MSLLVNTVNITSPPAEHRQSLLQNAQNGTSMVLVSDEEIKSAADATYSPPKSDGMTSTDVVVTVSEKEPVEACFQRLRNHFYTGATRSVAWRKSQLNALRRMITENQQALEEALYADLKKSPFDSYITEIGFTLEELDESLRNVKKWMKPRSTGTNLLNLPGSSEIRRDPLGVVLIIAPWNYPIQLSLAPLVGAIVAGNCAVIKPSDIATAVDVVLSRLIPKYLDRNCFAVYSGGPAITTELMQQKWDLVFFTGSGMVGKIIATQAAKNLVPCVLELGGKSPAIVDASASLDVAARRIVWGKFINAGQTCVAPDYLLVHESVHDRLVSKMLTLVTEFYSTNPQDSPDFCNIINSNHHSRLIKLLQHVPGRENETDFKVECGGLDKLVAGNNRFFPPTLLTGVKPHHRVMEDEIFGPILPIMKYSKLNEVISYINAHDKPLALYIFSETNRTIESILNNTSAGGVTVNDTLVHLTNSHLPFGGVGGSGMGSYHGEKSFITFSHEKSVLYKSGIGIFDVKARYPPMTSGKRSLMGVVYSANSVYAAHKYLLLFFLLLILAGVAAVLITKFAGQLW